MQLHACGLSSFSPANVIPLFYLTFDEKPTGTKRIKSYACKVSLIISGQSWKIASTTSSLGWTLVTGKDNLNPSSPFLAQLISQLAHRLRHPWEHQEQLLRVLSQHPHWDLPSLPLSPLQVTPKCTSGKLYPKMTAYKRPLILSKCEDSSTDPIYFQIFKPKKILRKKADI